MCAAFDSFVECVQKQLHRRATVRGAMMLARVVLTAVRSVVLVLHLALIRFGCVGCCCCWCESEIVISNRVECVQHQHQRHSRHGFQHRTFVCCAVMMICGDCVSSHTLRWRVVCRHHCRRQHRRQCRLRCTFVVVVIDCQLIMMITLLSKGRHQHQHHCQLLSHLYVVVFVCEMM